MSAMVYLAEGASVKSCLPPPSSGPRLRIQPQIGQKLLDRRPPNDGWVDGQFPVAALQAVLHVDEEEALEQQRLTDCYVAPSSRSRRMLPGPERSVRWHILGKPPNQSGSRVRWPGHDS